MSDKVNGNGEQPRPVLARPAVCIEINLPTGDRLVLPVEVAGQLADDIARAVDNVQNAIKKAPVPHIVVPGKDF